MAAPSLIFIHGSWHRPNCYDRIIEPLRNKYNLKCIAIALPSTQDNPQATYKDDIDAARAAITSEVTQGRDVIIIAHSYGGMVGSSCIKGFTKSGSESDNTKGYVQALILIASGFTLPGLAFMDPFFGIPPPSWRVDKDSGYAVIVADPVQMFYHDLELDDAKYWVSQLTTQSLKALFEGGEHSYTGWLDVPTLYVGTIEDHGLPVLMQRIAIGAARGMGGEIRHVELRSSHSPFLSLPNEVVWLIMGLVKDVRSTEIGERLESIKTGIVGRIGTVPVTSALVPSTWFKYGIPLLVGRIVGWGVWAWFKFIGVVGKRKIA